MTVYALTNNKGNVVKNQFVRDNGKKKVFQSYDADIASVTTTPKGKVVVLTESWLYSATTTKYCCQFLSQEAGFGSCNKAHVLKLIEEKKIKVTESEKL